MTEAERELKSAERDLADALSSFRAAEEKLEAAEAWVSASIEREQAARFAVRAAALASAVSGSSTGTDG